MMPNQDNSDQAAFWSDNAGPKWVARQAGLDALMQPVLDGVLARADLRAGDRVLDIGCGTGASSLLAAQAVGPDGAVQGVDISAPLLAMAQQRAGTLPHVRFDLGDAASHDLPTAAFDRLISRFGVMFFADPVAAFAHMTQALRPDAIVSFATWGEIPENPFFTLPARIARGVLGPVPKSDPDLPGPFAFRDPARVIQILQDAGLRGVSCEVETLNLTPEGGRAELAAQMCDIGPARAAINHHAATQVQVATVQTALADALREYDADGQLRLPAQINFYRAVNP